MLIFLFFLLSLLSTCFLDFDTPTNDATRVRGKGQEEEKRAGARLEPQVRFSSLLFLTTLNKNTNGLSMAAVATNRRKDERLGPFFNIYFIF